MLVNLIARTTVTGLFAELQASEAVGIHKNRNAQSTGVVLARL